MKTNLNVKYEGTYNLFKYSYFCLLPTNNA